MSYIRSLSTYAYPDSDGGLVIHTDRCIDHHGSYQIGLGRKLTGEEMRLRYLIQIPADEFREMVRRILEECHPEWVTSKMIDDWMRIRMERDEQFRMESGG